MATPTKGPQAEAGLSQRRLTQLKWLTTIVPAVAVFLYETVRHDVFEHRFPTNYGNLVVGLLTLFLAYGFSELIFTIVARLQAQALARSQEIVALNAVIQERERLGRELHDGLAQLVAYVLVRLDTVGTLLDSGRTREASTELERLRDTADDLYADIRESITALRTRVSERGLPATLRDYLAEFEERHGITVELRGAELATDLAPQVSYQLLRIVQEALTNIRKHSGSTRAWVVCTRPTPTTLALTIGDDGRGFDPAARGQPGQRSYGLTMMRERAEGVGGTFAIATHVGGGTSVTATVPTPETALPRAVVAGMVADD